MGNTSDTWPAGSTYVFQGTVAEDATAGTHISTCTITPGAGNEFQLLYGTIIAGNGAANLTSVLIDDGTNVLVEFIPDGLSLAANARVHFPLTGTGTSGQNTAAAGNAYIVSGTMRLILRISTATVSLTHTFAVALRIRGAKPTVVLNDTIGTSTNTTNTDKVF